MKNFDVIETPNSYKLILKNQHYFDYSKNGFKFFLPKFTTEFNLKILRFNSTGFINGYLSMNKNFSNILNISLNNLKYYMTNYKSSQKQLDFLLKGNTIPYNKVTSISIEGYNIPPNIYNKLNKFIYFKINHTKEKNTLKYLVYSFYINLDKKRLNKFLKNSHISFKYFINNIYTINFKKLNTKIKKQPKKSIPYALKLHLFLYMKEFGFIPQKKEYKIDTNINNEQIINLYSKLNDIKSSLKSSFNEMFVINPQKKIDKFCNKLDNIANKMGNINFYANLKKPKCINYTFSQSCFKDITYFHNYTYFQLQKNNPPDMDTILKYGDYKTFNDVAKYYFEIGEYQKAEVLLQKAYALKHEPIIIHNLAVLYLTYSPLLNVKKAINYITKASLPIDYYNLGVLYYIGKGVKENNKKAREYFLKSLSIPYSKENIKIMNQYKLGLK